MFMAYLTSERKKIITPKLTVMTLFYNVQNEAKSLISNQEPMFRTLELYGLSCAVKYLTLQPWLN